MPDNHIHESDSANAEIFFGVSHGTVMRAENEGNRIREEHAGTRMEVCECFAPES